MRTLIISDIHANLTALNAVLSDAEPFNHVWCLGDIVGYGPDPNECISLIQSLPNLKCVKGNHDAAILGEIDVRAFNYEARASLEWVQNELTPENMRWLKNLEEIITFDDITLTHGSPRNPIWEYVMDVNVARENMKAFETQTCLVGHTHVPCLFKMDWEKPDKTHLYLMSLGEPFSIDHKCIINPGSTGQPRDHNPKASYMIYDDESDQWVYHRVEYDIESVQKRILAAGLPQRHASRLSEGW